MEAVTHSLEAAEEGTEAVAAGAEPVGPRPAGVRLAVSLLRAASDERLVGLARAGNVSAFEAIYDRHHRPLLSFCRHMLASREEGEDAVQQVFLSAYRDIVSSDKPLALRPWLFAIARNRCLSILRTRREQASIDDYQPATAGLADEVDRREELREVLADLTHLPEDQRCALVLAELGGFDHAEIGHVLGCPRDKVKGLIFQARTSLAADRQARAMSCASIREQLATMTGGALRRAPLRRHLRACGGCQDFQAEVGRQRSALAVLLPVAPSVMLKARVLSAVGIGSSVAGAGVTGGVGAVGGAWATKVFVAAAAVGAAAGGGGLIAGGHHARAPAGERGQRVIRSARLAPTPLGPAFSRAVVPGGARPSGVVRTPAAAPVGPRVARSSPGPHTAAASGPTLSDPSLSQPGPAQALGPGREIKSHQGLAGSSPQPKPDGERPDAHPQRRPPRDAGPETHGGRRIEHPRAGTPPAPGHRAGRSGHDGGGSGHGGGSSRHDGGGSGHDGGGSGHDGG
jgi:RNA polymerase sigma factor (sigma-70 family)